MMVRARLFLGLALPLLLITGCERSEVRKAKQVIGLVHVMGAELQAEGARAVAKFTRRPDFEALRKTFGDERFDEGTPVGPDGTPDPLYPEIAQIGKEFEKASSALAGTSVKSEVAILHSYDSRWAIQWQKHNKKYDPVAEILSYYGPLRAVAQSVDIVPPTASLGGYKLVVAPGLNVVSDAIASNLMQYVKNGGHLVLGQRSAMKDDDNGLWPQRQPGPLTDMLGGRVEQRGPRRRRALSRDSPRRRPRMVGHAHPRLRVS